MSQAVHSAGPGVIRGLFRIITHQRRHRYSSLLCFGALSLLCHLLVMGVAGIGTLNLTAPVTGHLEVDASLPEPAGEDDPVPVPRNIPAGSEVPVPEEDVDEDEGQPPPVQPVEELKEAMNMPNEEVAGLSGTTFQNTVHEDVGATPAVAQVKEVAPVPVRSASEFTDAVREKLSYRVTMYGIPVGTGELEAMNENNELRIRWSVRSNGFFSTIYPVSNSAETRIVGGKYIIASILRQEGSFVSDTGFTLCLREKKSVWVDRRKNVVYSHPLESVEVLDALSGLYLLRNTKLEPGKTIWMNIFDTNRESRTPIEVLREERINLPALRQADTVVVRPLLQTDALFSRSGDMLVWLTNDEKRVPVRMETRIPAGNVIAELVSAEVVYPPRKP